VLSMSPTHREQAESGLRFLGLIIFENKIKAGTPPAIQTLRAAHLACRMCTGDNPRTAISVGRECGMVSQSAHIFLPTFKHGACLLWRILALCSGLTRRSRR